MRSVGEDPSIVLAEAIAASGTLTLEWRQKTRVQGSSEVLWSDASGAFAPSRCTRVGYTPGEKWQELRAELPVQGALTGLRLDPFQGRGEIELAWLRLKDTYGKLGMLRQFDQP